MAIDEKTLFKVYPEQTFGGYSRVDGTVAFFGRANALLTPQAHVLDIGCGRGSYRENVKAPWRNSLRNFKGRSAKVLGIDVDPNASSNPDLDEFRLIEQLDRWPVEDSSIDLAISDYVLEHVEHPQSFFSECGRVLKPGGHICMRTPNRFGYVALLSSMIPNRFHASVTAKVQDGRKEKDVFPTFYRCNSKRSLSRLLDEAGFDAAIVRHEGEPSYLSFSGLAYRIGAVVHRLLPPPLTSTLLIFGKKR